LADVVVINKISEVGPAQLELVRKVVRSLNVHARLVETDFGCASRGEILDTGLFSEDNASRYPFLVQAAKQLQGARTGSCGIRYPKFRLSCETSV
jgi:G3E family GTPase